MFNSMFAVSLAPSVPLVGEITGRTIGGIQAEGVIGWYSGQ